MVFKVLEIFNDQIEPASSMDILWKSAESVLFSQGILHFSYSYLPPNLGGTCVKFQNWESGWNQHYKENQYHQHDELARYCSNGNVRPVYWNDIRLQSYLTKLSAKINAEALDFGVRGGLSCPLPRTRNLGAGIFSVVDVGDADSANLTGSWSETDIQLFGGLIHQQVAKLMNHGLTIDRSNISYLTKREHQCLKLVAEGKSTKEIADEISCSDRTVNFHIQNSMKKLGAVSRWKAVSIASNHL
jgi:LuxR family transcriptional regulator, transcriptional activator of the bioluminescence operon